MLQTPDRLKAIDPEIQAWLTEFDLPIPQEIEPGVIGCSIANFDFFIWDAKTNVPFYMRYPSFESEGPDDYMDSYGVCDSPQQFLDRFKARLVNDPRPLCVTFTHVCKVPGNREGWRWHKWGTYIGTGTPECEYLDDEPGFENGVYVYTIYQISGPEIRTTLQKRLDASMPQTFIEKTTNGLNDL